VTWIVPESDRVRSPNINVGRAGVTPDLIVLHYTAGAGDEAAAARVFLNRKREASAHFTVGRTGGSRQCVSLGDTAWHAGDRSKAWLPPEGSGPLALAPPAGPQRARAVNRRSVGIELCNLGWAVVSKQTGRLRATATPARHRNPRSTSRQWEVYPDAQVAALADMIADIKAVLPSIELVCGHEDVTHYDLTGKGSKLDPGPAFPWDAVPWHSYGITRVLYDFVNKRWARCENGAAM
jgi:N-acetylmuramoyl-L-alanine amidase